jgi:hypothetical protein
VNGATRRKEHEKSKDEPKVLRWRQARRNALGTVVMLAALAEE